MTTFIIGVIAGFVLGILFINLLLNSYINEGKTWISKLGSRFYKFEDDVDYKKRGGRTNTKPWAKIAKAKLKNLFRKQINEELYEG